MDWTKLQSMLVSQTAESQQQLAAKESVRLAKETKAFQLQEQREYREKQALEQRKRDRELREKQDAKLEESRKRKLETQLPKTRNLYTLKQERIKRGLDPSGKDDYLLDTPVKEIKAPASPKPARLYSPITKDTTLTREEQAAKKRASMFKDDGEESSGGMALARAQRAAVPSSSSRNSIASTSSLRRPDSPSNPIARISHTKSTSTLSRSSSSSSLASTSKLPSAHLSARDRLKAGFDSSSFIKLNTEKRDRRSIEEVEMDMRMKRNGGAGTSREQHNEDINQGKRRAAESTGTDPKRAKSSPLPQAGATSSHRATNSVSRAPQPSPLAPRPSSLSMTKSSSTGQRRTAASSEESDDSSCSRGDARPRSSTSQSRRAKEQADTREQIWKLMGRDRSRDVGRDYDSDESGSDMEVGGAELLREEERTRRLAEREDKLEAETLKLRAEQKRLKKVG